MRPRPWLQLVTIDQDVHIYLGSDEVLNVVMFQQLRSLVFTL